METLSLERLGAWPALEAAARAIEIGAHLVSERDGYVHHGIYAGNGEVIHYGGFDRSARRGPVETVPLCGFAGGRGVRVQPEPHARFAGRDVVARARSRIGEDRYRILTNNCEHFSTWCVSGVGRSEQVCRCLLNPWLGLKTLYAVCRSQFTSTMEDMSLSRAEI
ncbi:lecithin retinol acyltransferase family protein [Cupriavidus pauculus]|uniref:Hydrolase n=1 Tax=Cupriavidus pauculus TaxID=82633 RepID=A0A2N5C2T7_9BURK|nr:lecithin retinol acyltransferase family protein [Cupriavidus pauculus]PLP96525.1 hydrolase [Cupriavidus pauculus]